MTFQHLRLEISDQIGTITLDRPEKLNALSRDLHNEMVAAANQLQADDDVRVVIVTGAGRGFCSGADTPRGQRRCAGHANDRMDEFVGSATRRSRSVIWTNRRSPPSTA